MKVLRTSWLQPSTKAVILLAMILLATYGRKTYLVKHAPESAFVPRVKAWDCTQCIFDNGSGRMCIDQDVQLDLGWKFVEDYYLGNSPAQKYYSVSAGIYGELSFSFHPVLNLNQLYYIEILADLAQFTTQIFVEMVYYWNYYLCFNIGW